MCCHKSVAIAHIQKKKCCERGGKDHSSKTHLLRALSLSFLSLSRSLARALPLFLSSSLPAYSLALSHTLKKEQNIIANALECVRACVCARKKSNRLHFLAQVCHFLFPLVLDCGALRLPLPSQPLALCPLRWCRTKLVNRSADSCWSV